MSELTDEQCENILKHRCHVFEALRRAYKAGQESMNKTPITYADALRLGLIDCQDIVVMVEKFHGIE